MAETGTEGDGAIGVVGLGEVGSLLAMELLASGQRVCCLDSRPSSAAAERRAVELGISFHRDPGGFAASVRQLFVTVTADRAASVVEGLAAHLPAHLPYVDCSTKSPAQRDAIRRMSDAASLCFVDAAVMDSVRAAGQPVRVVMSGPGAEMAAATLADTRFVTQVVGGGRPVSAELKLCRSIFTKGQEILLVETLSTARALGVCDVVFDNLASVVDRDLRSICDVTVGSTLRHAARRAAEMGAAGAMAAELLGSAPVTEAVARVFEVISRELPDSSAEPSGSWEAVIERLHAARVFEGLA